MEISNTQDAAQIGLILTGGGARAAYQVGVLKAIAEIMREHGHTGPSPFKVVCGTSAGAINATALACRSDNFEEAVFRIVNVWENFRAEQVYRADSLGVLRTGAKWLTALSFGWMLRKRPKSLLDNSPLVDLLHKMLDLPRLDDCLAYGRDGIQLLIGLSRYVLPDLAANCAVDSHPTFGAARSNYH